MIQYNLALDKFEETEKINKNSIIIIFCNHSNTYILCLILDNYDTLHLHNEDDEKYSIIIDLFKNQNLYFKDFLDFFKK